MSSVATQRITASEYLAQERLALEKSEFYDGHLIAVTGGTAAHSLIKANLVRTIVNALASGRCRVFDSDMRLLTPSGYYAYPDVSVVCAEPQFADERQDVLLNPIVLIEVLSPTTERMDRGLKFEHYRTIPSLQEFLLVSQEHYCVEHFARHADGHRWILTAVVGQDSQIELPALSIQLTMAEIYAKVNIAERTSPESSVGDTDT